MLSESLSTRGSKVIPRALYNAPSCASGSGSRNGHYLPVAQARKLKASTLVIMSVGAAPATLHPHLLSCIHCTALPGPPRCPQQPPRTLPFQLRSRPAHFLCTRCLSRRLTACVLPSGRLWGASLCLRRKAAPPASQEAFLGPPSLPLWSSVSCALAHAHWLMPPASLDPSEDLYINSSLPPFCHPLLSPIPIQTWVPLPVFTHPECSQEPGMC